MAVKITVVVPTHKRIGPLIQCLQALVNQEFDAQEYEVIVIMDGPGGESKELTEIITSRLGTHNIALCSTPVKKGPAAARNMGWKMAKGLLVVFTDDDCLPSPGWLASYWKFFTALGEPVIALNGPVQVPLTAVPTDYEKNVSRLEQAEFVTANCACSREALLTTGGFDEAFAMAWREDSDLHFKLLQAGIPLRYVAGALVKHPVRKAKFGVSLVEQRKSMYNALLFKKYPQLYRQKIATTPLWTYYLMIVLLLAGIGFISTGYKATGLAFIITWAYLVINFTARRLNGTQLSVKHVIEMIVTSVFIPFLSVYWTLYGSFKFKKLLL